MNSFTILNTWRKEGYINDLIIEFARFLQQIDENIHDEVILASVCCMWLQQNGHMCLDLNKPDQDSYLFQQEETGVKLDNETFESWKEALKDCEIVSKDGEINPLVLEGGRLYIYRFWKYEGELVDWIINRSARTREISKVESTVLSGFADHSSDLFEVNWQQVAVCLSFLKDFLVISGGPGTGKTYTVLNIIAAHALANTDDTFRIALAAPTGKAARRLINSITEGKGSLSKEHQDHIELPEAAVTVHKLLGANYSASQFKYNRNNPLPYNLIVIDEVSMLDITMWIRLLRAVGPNTKLIVLGDKDQLASVEAGSVLGDICGGKNTFSFGIAENISKLTGINVPVEKDNSIPLINDCLVFLTKSYRFSVNSGIKNLSEAINRSDFEKVLAILKSKDYPDVQLLEPNSENMSRLLEDYALKLHQDVVSDPQQRLSVANGKKILCVIRKSDYGTERINLKAEQQVKRRIGELLSAEWYDGRPVMATKNNSLLRIRNGELGIYSGKEDMIYFEGENGTQVSTARITDYEPAFAITIHKSQGSEFEDVAIVLPSKVNTILSKEILYTAVTRARRNTLVIAKEDILKETVTSSISRNSGIRQKCWG